MRAVIQRVSSAQVAIEGEVVGRIGAGLLVLLGVQQGDTDDEGRWLAEKIAALRIFEDSAGKLNLAVTEFPDESPAAAPAPRILAVSQFTLIASTRKGNRPSFNDAAKPDLAIPLYESFVRHLERATARPVATGRFGAMMAVSLVNDGPVTLVIDSRLRE